MMRLLIIICLFYTGAAMAQQSDTLFGKPLFWYRVTRPWAMLTDAAGPMGPSFILYNTGKVLYWKNGVYKQVQLSEQEKDDVVNELDLEDAFFRHTRFIDATNDDTAKIKMIITDQPSSIAYINFDTLVRVAVYGNMRSHDIQKRFPRQMLHLHNVVQGFNDDRATTWIPPTIEVLLTNYSDSPGTPIQWPTGWPGLNSKDARKNPGSTSLFFNRQQFNQLAGLIKQQKKQVFEIDGEKCLVGYRFPLPGL